MTPRNASTASSRMARPFADACRSVQFIEALARRMRAMDPESNCEFPKGVLTKTL